MISLCAMLFIATTNTQAQVATTLTGSGDSVVNTGTKYLSMTTDGYIVAGNLFATFTKTSGTVRGTVTVEVTPDGTNWFAITNGVSHTVGGKTYVDTLTNVATQYFYYVIPLEICPAIAGARLKIVGAGASHYILTGTGKRRKGVAGQ